jgi:iron complex outermembrane receptor protein
VTIRDGLPALDLLAGDVAGVGTGRQRSASEANLSLTDRGTGLRLSADRIGRSFLQVGPPGGGNLLTFGRLTHLNAKLFADTARLFPHSAFARSGRIALSVENIANARQTVSDESGATPFGYQPVYRDPIGRTVTIELRKSF